MVFNQPPAIFPISLSARDNIEYLELSKALISQRIFKNNLRQSTLLLNSSKCFSLSDLALYPASTASSRISVYRLSTLLPRLYRVRRGMVAE